MAKTISPLLPATAELLSQFGERLRLARKRRGLTAKQVADRAGMASMTLRNLERGGQGVTMGAYVAVMQVLGIEGDLDLLAKADPLGRELQDSKLTARRPRAQAAMPAAPPSVARKKAAASSWSGKDDFASAESLSALIAAEPAGRKKR